MSTPISKWWIHSRLNLIPGLKQIYQPPSSPSTPGQCHFTVYLNASAGFLNLSRLFVGVWLSSLWRTLWQSNRQKENTFVNNKGFWFEWIRKIQFPRNRLFVGARCLFIGLKQTLRRIRQFGLTISHYLAKQRTDTCPLIGYVTRIKTLRCFVTHNHCSYQYYYCNYLCEEYTYWKICFKVIMVLKKDRFLIKDCVHAED